MINPNTKYPVQSLADIKQKANKRVYHSFLFFNTGTIIDHREDGFHVGNCRFNTDQIGWRIGVGADQVWETKTGSIKTPRVINYEMDLVYCHNPKYNIDKDTLTYLYNEKMPDLYSIHGEYHSDIEKVMKGIKVPAIEQRKRFTSSTMIAWLYGFDDFYLWDDDMVYTDLAEADNPGSIVYPEDIVIGEY